MNDNTKSGVYQIVNESNGMIYIGSSKNMHTRIIQHKSDLRNGRHKNPKLQNAFDKYGESNFRFAIIEYVDNENNLFMREQHHIDKTNSCDRNIGYNLNTFASGGGGAKGSKNGWYGMGYLHNNFLNPFYGKTHTNETRQKLSDYAKSRIGELNPNHGNKGIKNPLSKQIYQVDTKTLKPLKLWPSSIDITRNTSFHGGNICKICILIEEDNVWKQYKGFYWCYKKDIKKINSKKDFVNSKYKRIIQLDKKGNEAINEFKSVTDAGKKVGLNPENISRVCKGKNDTSGGYKWMYKEDYENMKVTQ